MATTQRHIAERLQLSRSLVAGVLNDHPTVYASAETRRKVFEAAREMNYRPHAAARALRSGKTRVVTFCCANFDSLQEVSPKREIGMEGLLDSLAIALGKHDYKLQVEFVAQPQQWMAAMNEIAIIARLRRSCAVGRRLGFGGGRSFFGRAQHSVRGERLLRSLQQLAASRIRSRGHDGRRGLAPSRAGSSPHRFCG